MSAPKSVSFDVGFVAGKLRPRFDGRHRRVYTPTATTEAEGIIHKACSAVVYDEAVGMKRECPVYGEGVPVAVRIDAYGALPESGPKRVRSEPFTVKPDADNVAKLVLDALNGLMWKDDGQVVELTVVKWPRSRLHGDRMVVNVRPGWDPGRETEE